MKIGNTVEIKDLDSVLKMFEGLDVDVFKNVKVEFQKTALAVDKKVKKNATEDLKVRTGSLRRSINQEVTGLTLENLRASIFSNILYAPIHEYGGTIKAKDKYKRVRGGPYLNIPTKENKTPSGVTRLQAREVFSRGGSIRGRSVWLDGRMMFALVKQVQIKPQLGMRKAVDDETGVLIKNLNDTVLKGV